MRRTAWRIGCRVKRCSWLVDSPEEPDTEPGEKFDYRDGLGFFDCGGCR